MTDLLSAPLSRRGKRIDYQQHECDDVLETRRDGCLQVTSRSVYRLLLITKQLHTGYSTPKYRNLHTQAWCFPILWSDPHCLPHTPPSRPHHPAARLRRDPFACHQPCQTSNWEPFIDFSITATFFEIYTIEQHPPSFISKTISSIPRPNGPPQQTYTSTSCPAKRSALSRTFTFAISSITFRQTDIQNAYQVCLIPLIFFFRYILFPHLTVQFLTSGPPLRMPFQAANARLLSCYRVRTLTGKEIELDIEPDYRVRFKKKTRHLSPNRVGKNGSGGEA